MTQGPPYAQHYLRAPNIFKNRYDEIIFMTNIFNEDHT